MHNILLIESHEITRYGIRLILNDLLQSPNILETSTVEEGLKLMQSNEIDLVLVDLDAKLVNPLTTIPLFKTKNKNVKLLIFTACDENEYALSYLKAGADGFLSKSATKEQFCKALEILSSTGRFISENLREKLINDHLSPEVNRIKNTKLSSRESEIISLLAKGKSTSQIAQELNLCNSTISTFKSRIFDKLKVDNLVDMIKKAEALQV